MPRVPGFHIIPQTIQVPLVDSCKYKGFIGLFYDFLVCLTFEIGACKVPGSFDLVYGFVQGCMDLYAKVKRENKRSFYTFIDNVCQISKATSNDQSSTSIPCTIIFLNSAIKIACVESLWRPNGI